MKNSSGMSQLRAVLPQPTAEFQLNSRPQINSSRLEFKQNPNMNGTTTNSLSNNHNIIHPLLMHASNNITSSSPSQKSTGINSQPQPSRGFSQMQKNTNSNNNVFSKADLTQETNNKVSFNRGQLPETPKQPRILSVNSQYLSYQQQFLQQQQQALASQTPTMKPSQSAIFKKSSNLHNDIQFEGSQNSNNLGQQMFQKPQHRKSSSQNIAMPLSSKASASPLLQHQIVNRIKEFKPSAPQDAGIVIYGSNQPAEGQKQYARNDKPSSARNSNNSSLSNKVMLSSVPQLPSALFSSPKKNAPSLLGNFITKVEKDDMMTAGFQGSSPYLTGIQGTSTKSARIISTKISSSDLNKHQQQNINLFHQNQSKGESQQQREGIQQQDQQLQGLLRNTLMNSKQLKNNSNDQQNQQQQQRQNRSSSSHANLALKSNSPKSENIHIKKIDQLTQNTFKNSSQQQQQYTQQQQQYQNQLSKNQIQDNNTNEGFNQGITGSNQIFTGVLQNDGAQQATYSPKKHKKSLSGFQLQSQIFKPDGTVSRKIKSRATTKHAQPGQDEGVEDNGIRSQSNSGTSKKEGENVKQYQNDTNNNFFSSKNNKEKQQNQEQNILQTTSRDGFNKGQQIEDQQGLNTNQPFNSVGSQNVNKDQNIDNSQKITSTSQLSQQASQQRIQTPSQAGRLQLSALVSSQKKDSIQPALAEKGDQTDEKESTQSCESETSTSHNNNTINNSSPSKTNTKNYNNSKALKNPSTNEELAQVLRQNGITQHPHTSYYIHGLRNAFKAPQSVDAFAQLYRQHFLQTCQGVLYSNLAKPANPRDLANKKVTLGPRNKKYSKTLVFDMDETLIHCNESTEIPSDVIVDIRFPTGEFIKAGINIRPFAREVLKWLSGEFEIIIFTASHVCYAEAVIDYLDPEKKYVHHRFFRDQCIQTPQGVYIKDLRIFQDRKLSEMVLIDNAAYSFSFQVDNGIPIIPFYDNKQDTELLHLVSYLRELHQAVDVREYNKTHLKMAVFNEPQGPQKVYDNLFKKVIA